jgi:hypothetical protein
MTPMWLFDGKDFVSFVRNMHKTVTSSKYRHGFSPTSFPKRQQCNAIIQRKIFQVGGPWKNVLILSVLIQRLYIYIYTHTHTWIGIRVAIPSVWTHNLHFCNFLTQCWVHKDIDIKVTNHTMLLYRKLQHSTVK